VLRASAARCATGTTASSSSARGTSLIGTWLTRFAIGYQTYALSHSALQLGLVAFFSQAPTSLIAPIAGVLVDRWDRHRTLIVTRPGDAPVGRAQPSSP
jgi:MFS family permease